MPDQWMATTLGNVSRGPVPRASTDHVASPAPADRSWRGVCPHRQRPQLRGGEVRRRGQRGPGQMAGRPAWMNSGGGQEPRQQPPGRHDARHDGTAPRRPRTNNAGTMPRGPATPPQPRCAGRRPVADGRHDRSATRSPTPTQPPTPRERLTSGRAKSGAIRGYCRQRHKSQIRIPEWHDPYRPPPYPLDGLDRGTDNPRERAYPVIPTGLPTAWPALW